MALVKKYCPSCGNETQINDEKPFSFCLHCGEKIVYQGAANNTVDEINKEAKVNIEDKLLEVKFYYETSYKKEEYKKQDEEPVYYLKAQDLLLDMSKQFQSDYRIWWEMSKPVDFCAPSSGTDVRNQYSINEDYFSKALDFANLEQKRVIIEAYDIYTQQKKKVWDEIQAELLEKERIETERIQREEAEKALIEEKLLQEQLKQEEIKKEEEMKKSLERVSVLMQSLANGEYELINNSYFELPVVDGNPMIGVFKAVGKCVYLNAYRIDEKKGNAVYLEQSIAIKFDTQGRGMKYDNTAVKIRGLVPPDNALTLSYIGEKIIVTGKELYSDPEYVKAMMGTAKKPIISLTKIFW